MNLEQIRAALRRDCVLDLSSGFVYASLHWKIQQLDLASYRQWTLQNFSGTLCVDELHLGRYTLLLATDPLHDFPVAFALVARNDHDHRERFLRNLQQHGFQPRVVVTDGSNLYPTLLAALWPAAEHQLCVFHVLQDINQYVLDALRRRRRQMQRRGRRGRKRHRGRRRQPARRRGLTLKDKAHFVYKHRYLIVKRRDHFGVCDQRNLVTILEYAPALRLLRDFVDQVHGLFAAGPTEEQARRRYEALRGRADLAADPDLARALEMLAPAKFAKMIAYLRSPVGQRVRTNNHVERTNRRLRLYEKVRYKWRRRRSIVGFVALLIHRHWPVDQRPQRVQPGLAQTPALSAQGKPLEVPKVVRKVA